ncbi:ADP-ribosyl cyclase/cyclic ADP-ribose hydrolase 1-like [Pelodytes ibericus]
MPLPAVSSWSRKKIIMLVLGILVLIIIIVASCVICLYSTSRGTNTSKTWKGRGTTRNLKEIVLGRCYDYLNQNPDMGKKDCNAIWTEFTKVLYHKDPCSITVNNYRTIAGLTEQNVYCNKSLLWSRTNDLVHQYTKASDFMTLEDTFLGYLFNGLTWCGMDDSTGMNFESCPAWNECANNTISSFWKMASATFARLSCGLVQVMLNGSVDGDIVRKESILRSIEIPSMNPERVREVTLWIMQDIDGPDRNSCSSPSVLELQSYIEQHNLTYSCIDNYRPVQLLQCMEDPGSLVCKSYN